MTKFTVGRKEIYLLGLQTDVLLDPPSGAVVANLRASVSMIRPGSAARYGVIHPGRVSVI